MLSLPGLPKSKNITTLWNSWLKSAPLKSKLSSSQVFEELTTKSDSYEISGFVAFSTLSLTIIPLSGDHTLTPKLIKDEKSIGSSSSSNVPPHTSALAGFVDCPTLRLWLLSEISGLSTTVEITFPKSTNE